MDFITLADITDEILQVKAATIADVNAFLTFKANSYGVAEPFATPAAKRIGVTKACIVTCLDWIGKDPIATVEGGLQDVYKMKLGAYTAEYNRLISNMRKSDFIDNSGNTEGEDRSIKLWRA